jgi:hypothetical protein
MDVEQPTLGMTHSVVASAQFCSISRRMIIV